MTRIEREKKIIGVMVDIYCKKKHKHKDGLCEECQELLDYSRQRLDKCKFGEEKTYCQNVLYTAIKKHERKSKRRYEVQWS